MLKCCLSLLLMFPSIGFGQQVRIENLQHVPFGDKIIISYELVGSTSDQQFLVKAVCNNGLQKIDLNSADGTGVHTVRGGIDKRRQIVWNVTNDTPELVGDGITFTVMATLLEKNEPSSNGLKRGGEGVDASMVIPLSIRKETLYNQLTSMVDPYLEEVYNEVTAFENFAEQAFESRTEFQRIDQQITKTNEAYNKLLAQKETFKQNIRSYWGSEKLNADVDQFFSLSLDKMHRSYLLPFNKTIKEMNEVSSGKYRGSERKKMIERIKIEIDVRTESLLENVNSLKGDAKALYENLRR